MIPLVEFTGEYQLGPQMGAALIAGVGYAEADNVWEVGAQFRYYVVGDFDHGMQVGAEVLHLGISTSSTEDNIHVTATAEATTLGGFVGYKFAASFGLTVDIQAGYQFIMMEAEGEASAGEVSASAKDEESDSSPLININFGWSF